MEKEENKTIVQTKTKEAPKFLFQTQVETVLLPSKGLTYPEDNQLSSGEVDLYYPDTSHEEILMSQKLIKNNTVVDKFLKSVIASDINYNDLIPGDKSALMIAARILLYGKNYETEVKCRHCGETQPAIIDLTTFKDAEIDYNLLNRENRYTFECPNRKEVITFKLLTTLDEAEVEKEIKFRKDFDKKSNREADTDYEYSTRLKHMIVSVEYNHNGNKGVISDPKELNAYKMLSLDSKEFKKYLKLVNPTIDTSTSFVCKECGETNEIKMPMQASFFWPTT